jgi:GR25 family glycosyltransferase involved in LPS biosynthesis
MLKVICTACILVSYLFPLVSPLSSDEECKWNKSANSPNIYWINMDKSVDRRIAMEKHLNDVVGIGKHFRVRGFTLEDIYIPEDIRSTWSSDAAKYNTDEVIPPRSQITKSSKLWNYKVILSSLYGRKKSNELKELGCTVSHLYAMRQAIEEKPSPSKYALIIEDDVQFLFNVDWDALVATGKSALLFVFPFYPL